MSDDEQHPSYSRSRAVSSKRHNHNFLERNRRTNMKDTFDEIRDRLPCFKHSTKGRRNPSRMQILREAANYFKDCKRGLPNATEINRMQTQQREMQRMIALISAATASGNFEAAAPYVDKCLAAEREREMPPSPEIGEDGDEDLEDGDEDLEDEEEETTDSDDSDDSQENSMHQADFR